VLSVIHAWSGFVWSAFRPTPLMPGHALLKAGATKNVSGDDREEDFRWLL